MRATTSTHSPSPVARVVEIGDVTAGIAVPDMAGTVRFYAARSPFHRLDGQAFPSVPEVFRAVRRLVERSRPPTPETPPDPSRPGAGDRTSELLLSAYGPFLQPL